MALPLRTLAASLVFVLPLFGLTALAGSTGSDFCGTDAPASGIVSVTAADGSIYYVEDRGFVDAYTPSQDHGEGLYVYREANGEYTGAGVHEDLQRGGLDAIFSPLTPGGIGDPCWDASSAGPDQLIFCDPCYSYE